MIARFLNNLHSLFRSDASVDRVNQTLVASMYAHPSNLALGVMCGLLANFTAASVSHNIYVTRACWGVAIIASVRVVQAFAFHNKRLHDSRKVQMFFTIGALTNALMNGILAALTVHLHCPDVAVMLTVTYVLAFATANSVRNAGFPPLAIGQMLLTLTPVMAALVLRDDYAMRVLALLMMLAIPTMSSITLNMFRVLRDSITAAETSARLADKMQVVARTDVVTGLLNRAGLNHALIEQAMCIAPDQKMALFWIDLDRFKEINDTLGHQTGDRLLAEVGARLLADAPPGACIGRFGGDEFIVACPAQTRRDIAAIAQRLLADISRPFRIDDDRLIIGCSIGIAVLPDDGADLDTVMQSADLALYDAKVKGRQRASFFDAAMTRKLVRRKEIEAELRLALQRDELSVFFQPIVDLSTGRIRAFEALVRWFHPDKGELRPDEFVPLAEETGAIITLGNWITAKAARIAATWPEDVTLAVNLSPLQIRAPGAAMAILAALREAGLAPSRLELEITETVLLDDSAVTEGFIAELSEAGVRFALDDFGTGYSSLSYLSKYAFSKIKVDRSFVSGEGAGQKSDAIIRAVSGMGAALGMEIVAEGLETIAQVQAVRQAGCTLGQGYYFSRAVPDYLAAMLLAQEPGRAGAEERKRA